MIHTFHFFYVYNWMKCFYQYFEQSRMAICKGAISDVMKTLKIQQEKSSTKLYVQVEVSKT